MSKVVDFFLADVLYYGRNSPQGAEPVEVTDFGHSGGLLSLCNCTHREAELFPSLMLA